MNYKEREIRVNGLKRRQFNQSVLQEAASLGLGEEVFQGRREVEGFTIDPPHSKDLDDAIWLNKEGDGYRISVSIADVTAIVRKNSLIDNEAKLRGATQYFSVDNDPMIPHVLSEKLLTLTEGERRPTITVSIKLDKDLDIEETKIESTTLISKQRFSYDDVDDILRDKENPLSPSLNEYYRIANRLLSKRRNNGALAIYDIFKGFATSEDGQIIPLNAEDRHMSNIVVQEFMILANSAVATYFAEHDIPALFRNHKAKAITADREDLMEEIENAVDYPETFNISVLRQRVGLTLNRAYYSPDLDGHYALNLPAYAHFTSPIRRYADVVNHRILNAVSQGKPNPYSVAELRQIGDHLSSRITSKTLIPDNVSAGEQKHLALRDKAYVQAERQMMDANRLEIMPVKEFSLVVKVVSGEGTTNPVTLNAIKQRLENGTLPVVDMHVLLLETKTEDPEILELKREILAHLAESPNKATAVVNMSKDILGWSLPVFDRKDAGPAHAKTFTVTARVKIDGKTYVSETITSSTAKSGEQLATINLLGKYLGIEIGLPDTSQNVERKVSAEKVLLDTNSKNVLSEYTQKNGFMLPTYDTKQIGPSHMPTFIAVAQIVRGDRIFVSEQVTATNKREAELLAAENLIQKMGLDKRVNIHPRREVPPIVKLEASRSYISELEKYVSENNLAKPRSITQARKANAGGGFTTTIELDTKDGLKTFTATATSSKGSRHAAAQKALQALQGK